VVRGRPPRHRGVLVGRVARVLPDAIIIAPEPSADAAPLKPGDGLVFDAAGWRSPEEREEGGHVYGVLPARGGQLELRFGAGAISSARIRPGDWVWRTHDPDLDRAARPFTEAGAPVAKQPVRVRATAHAGQPLELVWELEERPDACVTVCSDAPLAVSQNRPLDVSFLREQLGRLGNTPYELAELTLDAQGSPFAPSSLLNNLRRAAVEQLQALQSQP
ncbi:protease, partial [Kouleothrix aurantiaca]